MHHLKPHVGIPRLKPQIGIPSQKTTKQNYTQTYNSSRLKLGLKLEILEYTRIYKKKIIKKPVVL